MSDQFFLEVVWFVDKQTDGAHLYVILLNKNNCLFYFGNRLNSLYVPSIVKYSTLCAK